MTDDALFYLQQLCDNHLDEEYHDMPPFTHPCLQPLAVSQYRRLSVDNPSQVCNTEKRQITGSPDLV